MPRQHEAGVLCKPYESSAVKHIATVLRPWHLGKNVRDSKMSARHRDCCSCADTDSSQIAGLAGELELCGLGVRAQTRKLSDLG